MAADSTSGPAAPTTSVLLQFLALALVWGASFLFIEVSLQGLSPAQVVLGRLLGGAVVLVAFTVVRRHRLPRELVVWVHLAVVAVLLCVAPFLLFAWAQERISSGLASIYNATTPLLTMAVALLALPEERPTRSRLLGLLTGLIGVLIVLGPWRGVGGGAAGAQIACLVATACYGAAFVYLRRFVSPRGLHAVPVATMQVGLAAALMLLLTPFVATSPVDLSAPVVASVLVLGVVGTGIAYVWNTNVIAGWGATNASTVTYLTPAVGVLLGVVVLGESPTWNQPVGAAVVVLGVAVSQNRLATPAAAGS